MKANTRIHAIFVEQAERLRRLTIGMGTDAEQAKDVLQDVYLEMLGREPKFLGEKEVANWLMTVTVNKSLLEFRRQKRHSKAVGQYLQQQTEQQKQPALAPDQQAIHTEEMQAIKLCLDQMDESLRVVLVMKYFCKMNSTEIGETLKLEPGTVRKRLCTARIKLAKTLLQMGIKP